MARSRTGNGRSSSIGAHAIDQRVDLLGGHHIGKLFGRFGCAHQARHVEWHHAFARHKAEEAAHGGEFAPDGDGVELLSVEPGQPLAQSQQVDGGRLGRRELRRRQVVEKLVQIGEVGLDGVGGRRPRAPVRRGTGRSGAASSDMDLEILLERRVRAAADFGVAGLLIAAQPVAGGFVELRAAGRR